MPLPVCVSYAQLCRVSVLAGSALVLLAALTDCTKDTPREAESADAQVEDAHRPEEDSAVIGGARGDKAPAADAADAGFSCPADAAATPLLRCTGLYDDWETKRVAPGVTEFTPGYVLWSDG